MDGFEVAQGIGRHVSQRRVAVTAHAGPEEAFCAKGELVLNYRHARAGAQAAENEAVGIVASGAGSGYHSRAGGDVGLAAVLGAVGGYAGIDGLVREARDAEDFVVAEAGIEGDLHQHVGRFIKGVVGDVRVGVDGVVDGNGNVARRARYPRGHNLVAVVLNVRGRYAGADGRVVSAAVLTCAAQHGIWSVAGKRGGIEKLRILSRYTDGHLVVVEALDHAEAVLARPHEARDVVRVYGLRCHDIARRAGNALLAFGGQGPQLSAGNGPARVGLRLRVEYALAHDVAVRLVGVRAGAGTQEVSLVVAAHSAPVGLAFGQHGEARLAGRPVELAQRIGVRAFVRNRAESGGNVASRSLGAPHSFTRHEAAWRDADPLVVQNIWAANLLLDLGRLVGDRGRQRRLTALQIGDCGLQCGDGGVILRGRLLLGRDRSFRSRCRSLCISRGLLGLLQLRVLHGQVGLQAVDLALQLLFQRLYLICD